MRKISYNEKRRNKCEYCAVYKDGSCKWQKCHYEREYLPTNAMHYLIRRIQDISPVTPKTGHWIKMLLTDMSDIAGQCSECGFIHKFIGGHTAQYNYCPNCGARMVEPQESEEV